MKLLAPTLYSMVVARPEPPAARPQGRCLDKGYDYEEVRATLAVFGFTAHIRARGEEARALKHKAGVRARRWVVERSHSWLNRFRRLLIRWDKKAATYLAFLHFACALIAFRAAGLFG
jgi:putative transposase